MRDGPPPGPWQRPPPRDAYASYAELCAQHREGVDFDRWLRHRPGAQVVVLAPHGGRLENHTDTIAEQLAGDDFSLYCFRSHLGWSGPSLHLTSHRFDDPDCVALVAQHRWALAVHGCAADGERAFLGGLDASLKAAVAQALTATGLTVECEGHAYPGRHAMNICNRTASGAGVQLELTLGLRRSAALPRLIAAVRRVLVALPDR